MKRRCSATGFLLAGALSLAAATADAATRALVVGVSGYPALPENIRLTGPKNDSREVANTLVRLGVPAADITVLADGVTGLAEGIPAPGIGAKAEILAQLDRLAETSRPGDLVVFYFSGHGSQQTDLDGDEQGGFDEIFLPYDVKSWTGAGVENALVDDELNARVQKILDKGADFFGIIDACHSATGFRTLAEDDVRARSVAPALLGVPDADGAGSRSLTTASREIPTGRGRAAFFYAAEENEEALEKTPPGGEDGENFGVFTYNLLKRLNRTPDLTYRRLHQAVVSDLKRNALLQTQTPQLEGALLDEPVLGLSAASAERQWPIFGGKLQAGQLDGVTPGTIVALYQDPADPDDSAVAHGVVEAAGATRSTVSPVVYPCPEDLDENGACAAEPDAAAVKKGRFARIVEPGVDLSFVLSAPIRIDPDDGEDYSAAIAALNSAVGSTGLSSRVSLSKTGYDIAVALVDGTLAFSDSGGSIDADGPNSSPRLTLPDDPAAAAAAVSASVERMMRAMALQRLGDAETTQALGLSADMLVSRLTDDLDGDACPEDDESYDDYAAAGDEPEFSDCDVVALKLENRGRKPLDVTVLLVGADFSITTVWPTEGSVNRLQSGDVKEIELLQMEPNPESASAEKLVLITVPGIGKSRTIFDNLDQEGLRDATDEASETHAMRELLSVGLNDTQRSATSAPRGMEEEMSIDIKPFYVGNGEGG